MLPTEKVKQKSAKAIYYTLWCYSPYKTKTYKKSCIAHLYITQTFVNFQMQNRYSFQYYRVKHEQEGQINKKEKVLYGIPVLRYSGGVNAKFVL